MEADDDLSEAFGSNGKIINFIIFHPLPSVPSVLLIDPVIAAAMAPAEDESRGQFDDGAVGLSSRRR